MSFLQIQIKIKHKISTNPTSLTYFQNNNGNDTPIIFPVPLNSERNKNKLFVRRMSLSLLPAFKGSMTVEAACALPVFIFFVLNLLSVIEMLRLHGNLTYAMMKVGNELALYSYAYEELTSDDFDILETVIGKAGFSYLYIRERLVNILGEEYLSRSPVRGGKEGLVFAQAQISEDGNISMVLTYRLDMPFFMNDTISLRTFNSYFGKTWTGYDQKENGKTELAYVTENGSVYHLDRKCTYLCLSIKEVSREEAGFLRNESGGRYIACERCPENEYPIVYITDDGNRYHSNLECGGLKRTVYTLEREEAKKYHACSRCGKEE